MARLKLLPGAQGFHDDTEDNVTVTTTSVDIWGGTGRQRNFQVCNR